MATVSHLDERRELSGDKAERIVQATRASVANLWVQAPLRSTRGPALPVLRSGRRTDDFGTKERLPVQAVRRECNLCDEQIDGADCRRGQPG